MKWLIKIKFWTLKNQYEYDFILQELEKDLSYEKSLLWGPFSRRPRSKSLLHLVDPTKPVSRSFDPESRNGIVNIPR